MKFESLTAMIQSVAINSSLAKTLDGIVFYKKWKVSDKFVNLIVLWHQVLVELLIYLKDHSYLKICISVIIIFWVVHLTAKIQM